MCSVSMMWGGVGKPQILKGKSGSTWKSEPKGKSEPKTELGKSEQCTKCQKGKREPKNRRKK